MKKVRKTSRRSAVLAQNDNLYYNENARFGTLSGSLGSPGSGVIARCSRPTFRPLGFSNNHLGFSNNHFGFSNSHEARHITQEETGLRRLKMKNRFFKKSSRKHVYTSVFDTFDENLIKR